jgi:hypothetical protein
VIAIAAAVAVAAQVATAAQGGRVEFFAYRVTTATGTERVQFAGDPAAGCAERGVCGVSGEMTFTPTRPDLDTIGTLVRVGKRVAGQAFTSGGTTTAAVTMQGSDKPCTDSIFTRQAVVTFHQSGAKVQALLHGPVGEPPLGQDAAVFASRCAGPRVADLARSLALPGEIVPLSALRRRVLTLRLRADTPFSEAGYAGRVVADVRVRLRRDRALERILSDSGGLVISPGSAPGSSVAP